MKQPPSPMEPLGSCASFGSVAERDARSLAASKAASFQLGQWGEDGGLKWLQLLPGIWGNHLCPIKCQAQVVVYFECWNVWSFSFTKNVMFVQSDFWLGFPNHAEHIATLGRAQVFPGTLKSAAPKKMNKIYFWRLTSPKMEKKFWLLPRWIINVYEIEARHRSDADSR